MAENAIKTIEDQLNCSICLDTYTDPKQLQCFHVNCQKCLVKLVVKDQHGQLSLSCPTCRQVTPVPANGVAGLPAAFLINRFLEAVDKIKKTKDTPADTEGKALCSQHDKEVELCCETCWELICYKCALKGGQHHDHEYKEISEAFIKYKVEINSSLEPMKKKLSTIKEVMAALATCRGQVSDKRAAIEAKIEDTARKFHEGIESRKTELINKLDHISEGKLKELAVQMAQTETTQAQFSSCLDFMKEGLEMENEGEMLTMTIVKQMRELTTVFQRDIEKPNIVKADILFTAPHDIDETCQNYGQVGTSEEPCPNLCFATGEGIGGTTQFMPTTVILHARNYKNEECTGDIGKLILYTLANIVKRTSTPCIQDHAPCVRDVISYRQAAAPSQYVIQFTPIIVGFYSLQIRVCGQHITGSPFTLVATRTVS